MKRNVLLLTGLALVVASAALAGTTTRTSSGATHPATHSTATHEAGTSGSDMGIKSIGGAVAFVSPENLDGALGLGVFADCGRITPRLGLETRIDYWSETQEGFGSKATLRDVILGARGKYYFPVANSKFQPFAGGGLGIHMLHAKVTVSEPGFPDMTAESSDTKLGVDLGGGVSMPVGVRTDLLGEMWYGIVSDVSQLSIRVGLAYRL